MSLSHESVRSVFLGDSYRPPVPTNDSDSEHRNVQLSRLQQAQNDNTGEQLHVLRSMLGRLDELSKGIEKLGTITEQAAKPKKSPGTAPTAPSPARDPKVAPKVDAATADLGNFLKAQIKARVKDLVTARVVGDTVAGQPNTPRPTIIQQRVNTAAARLQAGITGADGNLITRQELAARVRQAVAQHPAVRAAGQPAGIFERAMQRQAGIQSAVDRRTPSGVPGVSQRAFAPRGFTPGGVPSVPRAASPAFSFGAGAGAAGQAGGGGNTMAFLGRFGGAGAVARAAGGAAMRMLPAAAMLGLAKTASDNNVLSAPDLSKGAGRGIADFLDPRLGDIIYGKNAAPVAPPPNLNEAPASVNGALRLPPLPSTQRRLSTDTSNEGERVRSFRSGEDGPQKFLPVSPQEWADAGKPRNEKRIVENTPGNRIVGSELHTPGAPPETARGNILTRSLRATFGMGDRGLSGGLLQDSKDASKLLSLFGVQSKTLEALQKKLAATVANGGFGADITSPNGANYSRGMVGTLNQQFPNMNQSAEGDFGSTLRRRPQAGASAGRGGAVDSGPQLAPGTVVTPGRGQTPAQARADVAQQQAQAAMPAYSPGMSGSGALGATMQAPGLGAAPGSVTGLPLTSSGSGASGTPYANPSQFQDPRSNPNVNQSIIQNYDARGKNLPVVIRNNNPAALSLMRPGSGTEFAEKQEGYVGATPRPANEGGFYAKFATPEHGIAANAALLERYGKQGVNTPDSIVRKWSTDSNAWGAYSRKLQSALGVSGNTPVDLSDKDVQAKILTAKSAHESGTGQPIYTADTFKRGVNRDFSGGSAGTPAVSTAGLPESGVGSAARTGMNDVMGNAQPGSQAQAQFGSGTINMPNARQGETQQQLAARIQATNPSLGNGECVALAKQIAGSTGQSVSEWRRGTSVMDGSLPIGSPIATFKNRDGTDSDKYDGGQGVGISSRDSAARYGQTAGTTHAAVLTGYDYDENGKVKGIKVSEQWRGSGGPRDGYYSVGDRRGNEKAAENYYSINDTRGRPIGDQRNPLNRQEGTGTAVAGVGSTGPITAPNMPGATATAGNVAGNVSLQTPDPNAGRRMFAGQNGNLAPNAAGGAVGVASTAMQPNAGRTPQAAAGTPAGAVDPAAAAREQANVDANVATMRQNEARGRQEQTRVDANVAAMRQTEAQGRVEQGRVNANVAGMQANEAQGRVEQRRVDASQYTLGGPQAGAGAPRAVGSFTQSLDSLGAYTGAPVSPQDLQTALQRSLSGAAAGVPANQQVDPLGAQGRATAAPPSDNGVATPTPDPVQQVTPQPQTPVDLSTIGGAQTPTDRAGSQAAASNAEDRPRLADISTMDELSMLWTNGSELV